MRSIGRRFTFVVAGASLVGGAGALAPAALGSVSPALGVAGGCSAPVGAWPMYQGGPSHDANACSSIGPANVATLRPAWFTSTPGTVNATPAVVGGTVYVGDSTGTFYALSRSTGAKQWTFAGESPQACYVDQLNPFAEKHQVGNPEITSSAAVASVGGRSTVFVGIGGSLFALDAATGRCLWAQDTDPGVPTDPTQVESSPVVDTTLDPPEVMVGNDDDSSSGIAVTGLMAFDAANGALLWKYEPERDLTLRPAQFGGSDSLALSCGDGAPDPTYCNPGHIADLPPNSTTYADGCGDVWSSPALDPTFADPGGDNTFQGSGPPPAGWAPKQITASGAANRPTDPDGLVVFGTGNCGAHTTPATALAHGDYAANQGVYGLDPVTGVRVWSFLQPYNLYNNNPNEPWAGDDDFGSSALIARVPAAPRRASCPGVRGTATLVIEGSKDGYAHGLCEATGRSVWSVQAAQPGQLSQDLAGSIGGFIGSPALGAVGGRPTAFFTSSIPLPFSNDGFRQPGDGDTNISHCPGLEALPLLPVCPDLTLLQNPARLLSLHAIDAATGRVDWHALSLPSYAAASFTNGVVFDPETIGFGLAAYDATTGLPLWAVPLGASPSSAAAVAGDSLYIGAGTADQTVDGQVLPPQALGVWSFTIGAGAPHVNNL